MTTLEMTPARIAILRRLQIAKHEKRRMGFADLDRELGTSHPTSREHFEILRTAKLVARQLGRQGSLRITDEGMRILERNER